MNRTTIVVALLVCLTFLLTSGIAVAGSSPDDRPETEPVVRATANISATATRPQHALHSWLVGLKTHLLLKLGISIAVDTKPGRGDSPQCVRTNHSVTKVKAIILRDDGWNEKLQ